MAEGISIPSPSVFLRASPDPPRPEIKQQQQLDKEQAKSTSTKQKTNNKKKSTVASSKPRRDGAAVAKPKQSKSRNGRSYHHEPWCSLLSLQRQTY